MKTTIDQAGRVVIPKVLRELVGLRAGAVEVHVDGSGLRMEPISSDTLEEIAGRLVVPRTGEGLSDDDVRRLRAADQR